MRQMLRRLAGTVAKVTLVEWIYLFTPSFFKEIRMLSDGFRVCIKVFTTLFLKELLLNQGKFYFPS